MTRRIPPRSAVAAADPGLARLATVDLDTAPLDSFGVGRASSLRDLARSLVPAAFLPVVPERVAITDRIRAFGRRSR